MKQDKEKIGILLLTAMILFFLYIIITTSPQETIQEPKKGSFSTPELTRLRLDINKINSTHIEIIWNSQGYTSCEFKGAVNIKNIAPGGIKTAKIEDQKKPLKLICTKLNGSKDEIEKRIESYYLNVIDYDKNAKEGYQTYIVLEWNLPKESDNCVKGGAWSGKINNTGTYKDTNFKPGNIDSYNKTYIITCYKNNKKIFNTSLNLIKWWLE